MTKVVDSKKDQNRNALNPKKIKINDLITLKLEGKKTIIYVGGEPFNHCKF